MKKLFTVLAVLLVASVAFAAVIKGDVTAEYTFNFDKKTIVYGAPGVAGLDATLNFDPTELLIVGDAEATHIEAKVTAGVDFQFNDGNNHDTKNGYKPLKKGADYFWYKEINGGTADFGKVYVAVAFDVDTFKIVGKDWEIDFVNNLKLDFAKSAIDNKRFHKYYTEDNTQYYSLDNSLKGHHNLTATFMGYSVGFGLGTDVEDKDGNVVKNDWTDALNFAMTATTPDYAFGDFTIKAGAGYQVYNNDWALAGSAKAAYAAEKFSFAAALDTVYADEFAKNEVAVNVAVAPVTVDLYWNNEGATVTDSYWKYYNGTKGVSEISSNYFSAKVVVDVAKVAENVPVKVTFTGKDLVNENKQILNLEAETTIVPNFKFGVYFKDICDQTKQSDPSKDHRKFGGKVEFTGVQNLTLNAEAAYKFAKEDTNKKFMALVGASYAHELFTASASIACDKVYDCDALFAAKAAVVSSKLVAGAELSAKAYFNLNESEILDEGGHTTNELILACKVTF